jgi:hypothetical protein
LDTSNSEHNYLKELKQNTEEVLSVYYFRGDRVPKLILNSALDVVEKAYRLQKRQKESPKDTSLLRQKYSYRIVIIVCGCYIALQTARIPTVTIDCLCFQVSRYVSHQHSSHTFATPKDTAVLKMLQQLKWKKDSSINTRAHRVPMHSSKSRILRR